MSVEVDRNYHIKEFLRYYVALPHAPNYAVMLNGSWGIGKTFLLEYIVKKSKDDKRKTVYVSLNGLSTFSEIDAVLYRALYPILGNKVVSLAEKAARSLGKFYHAETDIAVTDFLNRAAADLYIFDDLERCAMPIERALGYINSFVEHDGRKVIVAANEREIPSQDYSKIREKVIGKTFEVQPALNEAFAYFSESLTSKETKLALQNNIEIITETYENSQSSNLRILRHTMWDFERLYDILEEKHKQKGSAIAAIARLFFALSFELKAGHLEPIDLENRASAAVISMMRTNRDTSPPSRFQAAQAKYTNCSLRDSALSDETLIAMLVKGIFDGVAIRRDLDASSYYVTVADEPAWRTVWYAWERTEEEIFSAMETLENEFATRQFTLTGEALHVFGIRLWLTKIGVMAGTQAGVVEECKRYIDDLYLSGRIELAPKNQDLIEISMGYGGLGMHEGRSSELKILSIYFQEKRRQAAVDRLPLIAQDLLTLYKKNSDFFNRMISYHHDGQNEYVRTPVLSGIDANDFVSALLSHHPIQQRSTMTALSSRYEGESLRRELQAEENWAQRVREKLLACSQTANPIVRERIRAIVQQTLDKVLDPDEPSESPSDKDFGRG